MTNPLIAARDQFTARHPEIRSDLNGRNWGYFDVGAGHDQTLLLIPGTLGRGDIFWNQITALSTRVRVLAISYPDSGGIIDWADDIILLLDRLGINRVSLLGSSLGGYLAQYISGTYPDRVAQLLAANTLHSVAGLDQRAPYALDLGTVPIADLRAGFRPGLTAWKAAHPEQGDLVEMLFGEVDGRILKGELRARISALKTAPDLPPVTLPTGDIVTIDADDDPLVPPEVRAGVRSHLTPGVAYRFLSGGHFPYVARAADYTALLEQVLGLDATGPDWGTGAERSK